MLCSVFDGGAAADHAGGGGGGREGGGRRGEEEGGGGREGGRRGGVRVFRLRLSKAKLVQKQVLNVTLDCKICHEPHVCSGEHGGAEL
jgi:hypothetical protein